jgi:eukaryotic translation initiation factor 2C
VFTIVGFTKKPASELRFQLEGKNGEPDRTVTLPEYFKRQYNLDLRKPRLPCAILGSTTMIP